MFQEVWYGMGRMIVDAWLRTVMQVKVNRDMPIPAGAKIIAVNHPTTADPAYVTTLLGEHTSILIKETLFKVPLFGRSLKAAGHIPVLAEKGKLALEEAVQRLQADRAVMIFPEGEISPRQGGMHKAHSGAARLALLTGAPVVPVGIAVHPDFIHPVLTRVEGKLELGNWYFFGPYAMTIGEPMFFTGEAEDRHLVHSVTEQIMHAIASLSRESARHIAAQRVPGIRSLMAALFGRLAVGA